jgi:hydroxypyruvate isomerase
MLRAPFIVTQVGQDSGAPMSEQYASVIEGLRQAVGTLTEYGVTLLVEPLNTKVDHKGYILEKSADAFAIIDAVGSERVRLVYDIYHQQISEGNIIPTICKNLDKIVHLHGAANPGRCEIFLGENDYRVIAQMVEDAGYQGALTLEYKPTLPPEDSLKQTLEYMKM